MSQRVSTAGMYLAYAVGAANSRPTSGYTTIPEVKSMPSFNPSPETIESTTLAETEYKTYVEGLKDLGGALEFGANLTDDLVTFWETMLAAYDDAVAVGNVMWFVIAHPKLAKATYFQGDPAPIGINEAAVSAMAETTLYITPNSAPVMAAKPNAADVTLDALMVDTLLLTPRFNPAVTRYAVATTASSNNIIAHATDTNASVAITSTDATISTNTATWATGPNEVKVTVTNGGATKEYILNVTKS